jgi:hypothetical protein
MPNIKILFYEFLEKEAFCGQKQTHSSKNIIAKPQKIAQTNTKS